MLNPVRDGNDGVYRGEWKTPVTTAWPVQKVAKCKKTLFTS